MLGRLVAPAVASSASAGGDLGVLVIVGSVEGGWGRRVGAAGIGRFQEAQNNIHRCNFDCCTSGLALDKEAFGVPVAVVPSSLRWDMSFVKEGMRAPLNTYR